jgi:LasA protease
MHAETPHPPATPCPPRRGPRMDAAARLVLGAALTGLALLTAIAVGRAALSPGGGPGGRLASGPGQPAPTAAVPPAGTPRNADRLLEDAEFVFGAAAWAFDSAGALERAGSPLAGATEPFRGRPAAAGEIVNRVALEHSLDPRTLVALLAMDGVPAGSGIRTTVEQAASWLDDGYYGLKYRGERQVRFAGGSSAPGPLEAGAAHFAVARYLALGTTPEAWRSRRAAFAETYERLFGSSDVAVPATVPTGMAQPPLLLPWPEGETWHYTGGPHGGWGVATAWAAVDFAPPTLVGCAAAPEWVVASAPGVVAHAADGLVLLDLDGDGNPGTGWVVAYLHIAAQDRVRPGAALQAGDRIGHPSCEGGRSSGAHVHLGRRLDGEWVPATGGPAPLVLSDWTFGGGTVEYDGAMARAGEATRLPVAGSVKGRTGVASDNGPARRTALAASWAALAPVGAVGAVSALRTAAPAPPEPGAARGTGAGGATGGTIAVTIALGARAVHDTPLIVGLARAADPTVVVMARTDPSGATGPIALPPLASGTYTLTVRAPGFAPAQVFGIAYAGGDIEADLAGGGHTPLRPGDVNGDDVIDLGDVRAWLTDRSRGRARSDVDGNGRVEWADLALVWQSRTRQ